MCIDNYARKRLFCFFTRGKMADIKQQGAQNTTTAQTQSTQPAQAPPKTKVDMIAEIKKLLVKNNMTIDDNSLLALIEKIQIQGMSMKARIDLLELQVLQPVEDEQEIIALPRGKHYVVTRTFQGWVDFNDQLFKNIISNFENKELSAPYIDKEHDRAESFGDILGFRIGDKGLFSKIKLNKFGTELIKERAYKYISPTITNHIDTKGNKITDWLATISLVNSPALLGAMPALQDQLSLQLSVFQNKEKNKKMDNLILQSNFNKINEMLVKFSGKSLSLAGEISPEAVAAVLSDIMKMLEDLMAKIQELTGQKDAADKTAADATAAANEVNKQMAVMLNEKKTIECEVVIKDAIEYGVYHPNEKFIELKKKEFMADPQKIKDEITVLKSFVPAGKGQFTSTFIDSKEFSQEDLQIAKSAGFDLNKPEDKAKFLEMKREDK